MPGHSAATPESQPPAQPLGRPALWVRALSRLPFPALYAWAALLGWLACRVVRYRQHVVRENLTRAFPDFDAPTLRRVMCRYYAGFAQVLVELIKAATLSPEEINRRVRIENLDAARTLLAQGTPVILVAAHQCNWEWLLLALALQLGYPVDAAYKPLVNAWAEREMRRLRTRFGSRLVPAQNLLADILQRRGTVRAIAMVADQEPTTSERKHWTVFLNRDTAFFMGAEEIARVTRYPVFFIGARRIARGFYQMRLTPLAPGGERLATGELTERYKELVEAQIRAAPPDWPWSHKRWRLREVAVRAALSAPTPDHVARARRR